MAKQPKIDNTTLAIIIVAIALAAVVVAVVVILMLGFIGGTALQRIADEGGPSGRVVACYGDESEIAAKDIMQAGADLQVLRFLSADRLLLSQSSVNLSLLSQLLFPDPPWAAGLSRRLTQAAMQGQLDVGESDIDAFFREVTDTGELYWLLLNAEAKEAGAVVSDEEARSVLTKAIPLLNQGSSVEQVTEAIGKRLGVSEEQIISVFADLLGILSHVNAVAFGEVINSDYVRIDAASLVDEQAAPTEEQLVKQFEAYKDFRAGEITNENPYGFGYRLPAKVRLEYIMAELDDNGESIDEPTAEEMEQYYVRNPKMFERMVPSDANDPNSEQTLEKRSFAEVADQIRQTLMEEKAHSRVNMIMSEVKDATEAGFFDIADLSQADSAELKAHSVDYAGVAAQLSPKYKTSLIAGTTELLTRDDLTRDELLGSLTMEAQYDGRVPIDKIVFSVSELSESELGRFDVPTPKMWESIGLMTDGHSKTAVARVVGVQKATAPASPDASYDRAGASVEEAASTDTHRVKDEVIQDCRLLKAMEAAKSHADEFAGLVAKNGWDNAIAEYNRKYETARIELTSTSKRRGISQHQRKVIRRALPSNQAGGQYAQTRAEDRILVDKLHAMIPSGRTEAADIVKVLGAEISRSYYVVRNVSRTKISIEDGVSAEAVKALELDFVGINSFGVIYLRPANIMERMNFRWVSDGKR